MNQQTKALLISTLCVAFLTLIKIGVYLFTNSVAVLSEAFHSGSDVLVTMIAFLLVKRAGSGPDALYRYGKERWENISALGEGTVIILAALFIGFEAISHLQNPQTPQWGPAIGVMIFSGVVTTCLTIYLRKMAKKTSSPALYADAAHAQIDVFSAIALTTGLVIGYIFNIPALDAAMALVVALIIAYTGIRLIQEAAGVLTDQGMSISELENIYNILDKPDPGVTGYHRLRTRASGTARYLDVHVTLEPHLSIGETHTIITELERRLRKVLPGLDVIIHPEPEREAPTLGEDLNE